MTSLVGELVRLGHRRIGYLSGQDWLYISGERERGYRRALRAAGLPLDRRLLVDAPLSLACGVDGVDRLLAVEPRVTAIACANDLLAIGALGRLAELGLRVPEDVSVTGFDDIVWAGRTHPPLSTVRLPMRELGAAGFEHARQMLAGGRPRRRVLDHQLVLRGSSGPPAGPAGAQHVRRAVEVEAVAAT
jgi:LacI family transcriptional regulator